MNVRHCVLPVLLVTVGSSGLLRAEDKPLAQILPNLLNSAVVTPSSSATAGIPGNPHEAHFLPALAQTSAAYDLNRSLATYLSTFPLGSSSGGFTYETDPKTGIPKRSSGNFGPAYTERALTIGKGAFSGGVNAQSVGYDRFEGLRLDTGGDVAFYLQHNDCCPGQTSAGVPGGGGTVSPISFPEKDPAFEGDLLRMGLGLKIRNNTTAFFLNYGLTDTLDLGIAVPFVQVHLDATIDANIQRLSTTDPRIHTFVANQDVSYERFTDSGTATGLGDIAVRGKWNCLKRAGGGLALAFDLRLPTGNEDDLLGTGATQFRPMAIYSGEVGRLAPRASVGYTFSHGTISDAASFQAAETGLGQAVFQGQTPATAASLEVPDEINFTAGLSVAAHPRVTLGMDLLGRTIRDRNRFGTTTESFPYRTQNASAGGQVQNAQRTDVTGTTGQGSLTSLIGAAGLKWNLWGTVLLNANVLFPINDSGLRIEITPALGLDYSF